MGDLTEKTRILGNDDENNSVRTGRPVEQETRIVKHSRTETDKPAAKAKPKPTSAPPSPHSQISIPIQDREWIDVEPEKHTPKNAQNFLRSQRI